MRSSWIRVLAISACIILVSIVVLVISSGLLISYLDDEAEERNQVTREFLKDLSNDWDMTNLRRLLGDRRVNEEERRYQALIHFGSLLGRLRSCDMVAIQRSGEEIGASTDGYQARRCEFENGAARITIGAIYLESGYEAAYFALDPISDD